jgi:cell division protein FtsW
MTITIVAILVLGLIMVQSASGPIASEVNGDSLHYVKRQGLAVILGLSASVALAIMPYSWIRRFAWWAYAGVIIALVALMIPGVGREVNGSVRWIGVGGFNLQPSEFAKIAIVVCLGSFVAGNVGKLNDRNVILKAMLVPAPILVLVMCQPDFGTTMLLFALTFVLLLVGGLPSKWLLGLVAGAVAAGVPLVLLASYRLKRLTSFLDPWEDAAGSGYQVIQSMVAFQSGGVTGQGLGESHAKHLFLPEPWTDFVGSVMAEELGFVGVVVLISLYCVVVWRGVEIARRAPDMFGVLVAITLTCLLGGQAILNFGVVMGALPPKGLVLPFMSYGGSAVIVHLMSVGLILNVSANGRAEAERMLTPYRRAAVVEGVRV